MFIENFADDHDRTNNQNVISCSSKCKTTILNFWEISHSLWVWRFFEVSTTQFYLNTQAMLTSRAGFLELVRQQLLKSVNNFWIIHTNKLLQSNNMIFKGWCMITINLNMNEIIFSLYEILLTVKAKMSTPIAINQ